MCEIQVRKAVAADCNQIVELIKELARFQDISPEHCQLDAKTLQQDGFEGNPYFRCMVVESNENSTKTLIGYAIYFFTYSTFVGRTSYIEDIFVRPQYRGKRLGKKLWQACVQDALDSGCKRSDLSVLDSNVTAYEFYKRNGAQNITKTEGWNHMRLDYEAMKDFVKK